jgi:hypothetical protein
VTGRDCSSARWAPTVALRACNPPPARRSHSSSSDSMRSRSRPPVVRPRGCDQSDGPWVSTPSTETWSPAMSCSMQENV